MKDGEVSITLTRLERYIRKANDATDMIKRKRAEIHRLEDRIFSLNRDLEDYQDMLGFCISNINALEEMASNEGYSDEYLHQFMNDRKYKPRRAD